MKKYIVLITLNYLLLYTIPDSWEKSKKPIKLLTKNTSKTQKRIRNLKRSRIKKKNKITLKKQFKNLTKAIYQSNDKKLISTFNELTEHAKNKESIKKSVVKLYNTASESTNSDIKKKIIENIELLNNIENTILNSNINNEINLSKNIDNKKLNDSMSDINQKNENQIILYIPKKNINNDNINDNENFEIEIQDDANDKKKNNSNNDGPENKEIHEDKSEKNNTTHEDHNIKTNEKKIETEIKSKQIQSNKNLKEIIQNNNKEKIKNNIEYMKKLNKNTINLNINPIIEKMNKFEKIPNNLIFLIHPDKEKTNNQNHKQARRKLTQKVNEYNEMITKHHNSKNESKILENKNEEALEITTKKINSEKNNTQFTENKTPEKTINLENKNTDLTDQKVSIKEKTSSPKTSSNNNLINQEKTNLEKNNTQFANNKASSISSELKTEIGIINSNSSSQNPQTSETDILSILNSPATIKTLHIPTTPNNTLSGDNSKSQTILPEIVNLETKKPSINNTELGVGDYDFTNLPSKSNNPTGNIFLPPSNSPTMGVNNWTSTIGINNGIHYNNTNPNQYFNPFFNPNNANSTITNSQAGNLSFFNSTGHTKGLIRQNMTREAFKLIKKI